MTTSVRTSVKIAVRGSGTLNNLGLFSKELR